MSVLVVIPCLNEAPHISTLLAQLLRDAAVDRIIVADGGSIDGSQSIVEAIATREPRLILIDNPGRLQSAGINRAVALHGEGHRFLVRVDAHGGYPEGYVSALLAAAERQDATSVVVPMRTRGSGCFQRAAATAQNSLLGTGGSAHRHLGEGQFVDHGHHALMELGPFMAVGGYCETMACNEDAELDYRLAAAGGRIWLEPGAAIDYFPRRTPIALWRQYLRYGTGRARNVARHRQRLKPRQAIPLLVPPAVTLLLLTPVHPIFAFPATVWGTATLGGGLLIGARAGGGCSLLAGIAAMIMHCAWGTGYLLERIRHPRGVAARLRFSYETVA